MRHRLAALREPPGRSGAHLSGCGWASAHPRLRSPRPPSAPPGNRRAAGRCPCSARPVNLPTCRRQSRRDREEASSSAWWRSVKSHSGRSFGWFSSAILFVQLKRGRYSATVFALGRVKVVNKCHAVEDRIWQLNAQFERRNFGFADMGNEWEHGLAAWVETRRSGGGGGAPIARPVAVMMILLACLAGEARMLTCQQQMCKALPRAGTRRKGGASVRGAACWPARAGHAAASLAACQAARAQS